jgi:hypothetical protein
MTPKECVRRGRENFWWYPPDDIKRLHRARGYMIDIEKIPTYFLRHNKMWYAVDYTCGLSFARSRTLYLAVFEARVNIMYVQEVSQTKNANILAYTEDRRKATGGTSKRKDAK